MDIKYKNLTEIKSKEFFDEVSAFVDKLIDEATSNGSLTEQGADNEYTCEIGRLGSLCADFEASNMHFDNIKFKSPLLISIEQELAKRSICAFYTQTTVFNI